MIATRFAVAAHMPMLLFVSRRTPATSLFRAHSINTSSMVVRHVVLAANPGRDRPRFPLHARPDLTCLVGRSAQTIPGRTFGATKSTLHEAPGRTTLASLVGWLGGTA